MNLHQTYMILHGTFIVIHHDASKAMQVSCRFYVGLELHNSLITSQLSSK